MQITDRVAQTIAEHGMLQKGDRVCVALSGGSDSVALLLILQELCPSLDITLSAIHVQHGLRESAEKDAEFVRALCNKLSIPLEIRHVDIPARLQIERGSTEQVARKARYDCFEGIAESGALIATAHHLEDSLETVFINMARGCGLTGLCGIPYVRGRVIRPLLDVTKQQILQYLSARGQNYCQDETNEDTYYLRNFLRKEIFPRLAARKDVDFIGNMKKTVGNLQEDEAYLSFLAHDALQRAASEDNGCSVSLISALALPVRRRALTILVRRFADMGLDKVHFHALDTLLKEGKGRRQLRGDIFAFIRSEKLYIGTLPTEEAENDLIPLYEGEQQIENKKISDFIKNTELFHKKFTNNLADYDKISLPLFLRHRRSGDSFTHPTRRFTKTIKKMMTDDKIDATDRSKKWLVVDAKDHIIWVEDYGVNAPYALSKQSKTAIQIMMQDVD